MGNEAVAEPISKGPGDSTMASFDELEEAGVSTTTQQAEELELPNSVQKDNGRVEETKSPIDEKELKETEKKVEEKKTEETDEKKLESAVDKKTKTYKLSGADGKELEVQTDMMVEVPVRGKKEKVSVQDLVSNYSGKTDWSRKYSELNQDKQKFDQDKTTLQGFVDELADAMFEKQDVMGSIYLLAEAMGGDPVKVVGHFQKLITDKATSLKDLSPEELKIKELEERETLRQRQNESLSKSRESQRESADITARVSKTIETFGIDKARFVELYSDLEKSGDVPKDMLTPELVGEYHKQLQIDETLDKLIDEVNPNLGADKSKAKDEMWKVMKDNDFTVEDMRDIAVEVWGSSKSKNLAKKLKKSNPVSTHKGENQENPITFDDVD